MAPPRGMVYPLLQRALEVRDGLGRAAEAHASANVVTALAAVFAALAGQADLNGNAVPRTQVRDCGARCDDSTAGLVAEGQGLTDEDVAIPEVVEVVQVGAAEAGGLDGNLHLVGSGRGEVSFLETELAGGVQDGSLDGRHGVVSESLPMYDVALAVLVVVSSGWLGVAQWDNVLSGQRSRALLAMTSLEVWKD